MPAVRTAPLTQRARVLHEGDTSALDRPGDERLRSIRLGAKRRKGLPQRVVVVAVTGASKPAEGTQLRFEVAEREDLLRRLVRLELVAVDDDREAPEPVRRGRLERFPVLALLELAVPDHHDDAASPSEPALRQGDAAALGDAHAERPGVCFDPWDADIGMPIEPAEPPQSQEPFARNDSEREERRIEAGDVVALRGEEHVPIGILEAELGDVQLLEQEVRDDVERAEARPEMARSCPLDRNESVEAAHVCQQREDAVAACAGGAHSVELALRDQLETHARGDASVAPPMPRRGGGPSAAVSGFESCHVLGEFMNPRLEPINPPLEPVHPSIDSIERSGDPERLQASEHRHGGDDRRGLRPVHDPDRARSRRAGQDGSCGQFRPAAGAA